MRWLFRKSAWQVAALFMVLACPALAVEPVVFDDPAEEERFRQLTTELRCLVCQNQTIADSDAPLAHDLRDEIYAMMQAGKTDAEIKEFMVQRYGDFVLYRPPVKSNTLLLWLAPLILLMIGGVLMARAVRKRAARLEAEEPDSEEVA